MLVQLSQRTIYSAFHTGYNTRQFKEGYMNAMVLALLCTLAITFSFPIQQASPVSPQASQVLQQALSTLNGSTRTLDVTLKGSVHYIAGSDDETGTATLQAIATGASLVDLNLSSGDHKEFHNLTVDPPSGQWVGPDGVTHAVTYQNLVSEPSWFSPVAAISRLISTPNFVAEVVGNETLDLQNVVHVSVSEQPPVSVTASPLLPHLSQVDLYLDSSTFLPAAIAFNAHPDDNELIDIPIRVQFSDYRPVNGTQVPFHVQRFLNNGLVLDLQFDTATINSGLSASALSIQ